MKPLPTKKGVLWQRFLSWYPTSPVDKKRRADAWRAFAAGYRIASGGDPDAEYKALRDPPKVNGDQPLRAVKLSPFTPRVLRARDNLRTARERRS